MSSLSSVLADAGLRVSEPAFAKLVADALHELGPAAAEEPRTGLSRREATALEAVGADLSPRGVQEPDPRAEAAAAFAALLAGSLSVAAVARALAVDTSRVRHRLAARQLLGVRRPTGWRLPAYQFRSDGRPLTGLGPVAGG
ncbi:MAG: DNA-binding protein, partial [Actinomycetota bacterium]|nr:DNA-binding protein [Actinomycetota bacterium]